MIDQQKLTIGEYAVTLDIQPLADKMEISKEKCAELLADIMMEFLFPSKTISQNNFTYLKPY